MRSWLDRTPLASLALGLAREATGRKEPLEVLRPALPAALAPAARIGFWSLSAGVGASTVAALAAHRSAAGGHTPVLVDLDRWAPSLALRAGVEGATIIDLLLRPGGEHELVSRWERVQFIPGAPALHAMFDAARVLEAIERCAAGSAAVLDLGSGADALEARMLSTLDLLCVVAGHRAAQLQAAFCAVPLLRDQHVRTGLVMVGVDDDDAARVAERLPWPLLAAVPEDSYLAGDEFAARGPTLRAIDALIRAAA